MIFKYRQILGKSTAFALIPVDVRGPIVDCCHLSEVEKMTTLFQ